MPAPKMRDRLKFLDSNLLLMSVQFWKVLGLRKTTFLLPVPTCCEMTLFAQRLPCVTHTDKILIANYISLPTRSLSL